MSPDDRLEQALGSWSAARRLHDDDRARIRAEIAAAPTLDALWWGRFTAQLDRLVDRANRAPAGLEWADLAGVGLPRMGWGCAA